MAGAVLGCAVVSGGEVSAGTVLGCVGVVVLVVSSGERALSLGTTGVGAAPVDFSGIAA